MSTQQDHSTVFDSVVAVAREQGRRQNELARQMGVSAGRFYNWRRRGVPVLKVKALSVALGGALQPHQIRPDLPEIFPAPG